MTIYFIGFISLVSFVAGATATVVGFGIGSLITPVLTVYVSMDLAIAAVALPHLSGGNTGGRKDAAGSIPYALSHHCFHSNRPAWAVVPYRSCMSLIARVA